MHQPYYRDMMTGECTMPWVRLHGIHSYYDMLRLYREFPEARGTINFVPSLIEQLKAYAEEGASDAFLDHTLIPADDLTRQQKIFLLRHFFSANQERKIFPYGNYKKLFDKLGAGSEVDYDQAVRFFSTQEYRDLQVLFNLVWFGFAAREEIPQLESMLLAGGHFTEEDKVFVVEAQRRILANLIGELGHAASSENVELSTTPYYHPILPLIIDTDIAKRSMPKAKLPMRFSAPQIAREQLDRALGSMESWFGAKPAGVWPAEGSVCPEAIPMFAEAGVSWIATDDLVLKRSLPKGKRVEIHKPYIATHGDKEVAIVFRDHGLSNLIGFTYSKMPAEEAVSDFLSHLKKIAADSEVERRLVTVILDGENPWEHYPDSGREFLREFFRRIQEEGVPTTRVGDYISIFPPEDRIQKLHSGSWIDANFGIWIGKPQKNQGWNYLGRSLEELGDAFAQGAGAGDEAKAYESFCAACGSDWLWWFDDDFDSPFKGDFDRLFRGHLKNAFSLLGREVPLFLFEPIYKFEDQKPAFIEPSGFVRPSINGSDSSFFEWSNATRIGLHGRTSGVMTQSSIDPFEAIHFGFNQEAFYLRIEPVDRQRGFSLAPDERLLVGIHSDSATKRFRISSEGGPLRIEPVDEEGEAIEGPLPAFAANVIVEMGFRFGELGLKVGDKVTLTIALSRKGIEVRRYSHIHFVVPDAEYELRMWRV